MIDIREFYYKIGGLDTVSPETLRKFKEDFSNVKGVVDVFVDVETSSIKYALDQWTSDYDVLLRLTEICEEKGLEVIFAEDEVEEEDAESSEPIEYPEEDTVEEESEENDKSKYGEYKKGDILEKFIILGLSAVLIILGLCLKKAPKVQPWILMLGFTIASYETLYDVIVKLAEKKYVLEEILTFLGAIILMYLGYTATAGIIMLIYGALSFAKGFASHNLAMKRIKLDKSLLNCSNESEKTEIQAKIDYLASKEGVYDTKSYNLNANKLKINLFFAILAVLVVFIPPFFSIKTYWATLQDKWLYVGACVLILGNVGEMLFSLQHTASLCIFNALENGVKIEDYDTFLNLANARQVSFTNLGVLSEDSFEITQVDSTDIKKTLTVFLSLLSDNQAAVNAVGAYDKDIVAPALEKVTKVDKIGAQGVLNGKKVAVGCKRFFKDVKLEDIKCSDSVIYVFEEQTLIGSILVKLTEKQDSYGAIKELSNDLNLGVELLSVDESDRVQSLKLNLELDHAVAGANAKFIKDHVEKANAIFVANERHDGEALSEVINSITFGKNGKISIENEEIRKVPFIIKLSKRAQSILNFNKKSIFVCKFILIALSILLKVFTGIDFIWWLFVLDATARALLVVNSLRNATQVA